MSKFISTSNLDKLTKALQARYNEIVNEEKERAMEAENNLQAEIDITKDMFGGKAIKYITQSEYEALSEAEKNNPTVIYFITDKVDLSHEHENKDFLDNLDARNITIGQSTKTFDGVNDLNYSIEDIGAAPVSHNHDELYYTEEEIDGKIEDINETINNKEAALNSSIATAKSEAIAEAANKDDALHATITAETNAVVNEEKERATDAEDALQAEIDITKDMFGGKAIKYITQVEYEALSEAEKNNPAVTYFITDAEDTSHTHENKDFLDNLDARNITIGQSTKTFDGVNDLQYSIEDIGVAPVVHNHDELYYTETEIDGKIEDINETINTNVSTLNGSIATAKSEAIAEAANKDDALHVTITAETNAVVNEEKERAMEVENNLQAEIDITKDMFGGKAIKYVTQSEYNNLPEAEKNNPTVTYFITDAEDTSHEHANKDFLDNLNARNITIGNKTQLFDGVNDLQYSIEDIGAAPASHNHDELYYTEEEIDGKIEDINETINTNVSTLHGSIATAKSEAISESKSYADTAIANLVDSAPEAMNTLNELAKAIGDHQTEYEAYIATVAANIATAKSEAIAEAANKDDALHVTITAETNTVVNEEKERAVEVENNLQAEIDITKDMFGGKAIKYVTQVEYDNLPESEKNNPTVIYFITDKVDLSHTHENKDFLDNLNARNITIGNKTQLFDGVNDLQYSIEDIGAAPASHNHDELYYTEEEIDGKIEDINETINNKEVALNSSIQNLSNNKADLSYVNGKLEVVDAIKLNGYSLWVGTTTELESITEKDPNTLYFEIDDGNGEEVVQVDVVNGVLQLTNDKYQKTNMLDGTTIVFPTVSRFTEIHLYFSAGVNMNLNFPDCKWRVEPNIEEGSSYELIATYNTMEWLVNLVVYS